MHFSHATLRTLIATAAALVLLPPILLQTRSASVDAGDALGSGTRTQRPASDLGEQRAKRIRLREGTRIPPTVGRITLMGNRWVFLPGREDMGKSKAKDGAGDQTDLKHQIDFGFQAQPSPFGAGIRSAGSGTSKPAPVISTGLPETGDGLADQHVPQMTISENLMLQRIVEAIRLDASDDRWLISGEIAEFFDENRLLIRTAQRANGN
ncbi:MAG: hypothetical protein MI861_05690 [Pirellulales bacterium]|nr:hypothetical protein [Pirellulales bacterium]